MSSLEIKPNNEPQQWLPVKIELQELLRVQRRRQSWVFLGIMVPVVMGTVGSAIETRAWLAVAAAVTLDAVAAVALFKTLSRIPTVEDVHLLSDPNRNDEILVAVWVEVEGVVHGGDRGVLWFDSNGLNFHGHRSWFRLARDDFKAGMEGVRRREPGELDAYPDLIPLQIQNSGPRIRLGIREVSQVSAVPGPGEYGDRLRESLKLLVYAESESNLPTQLPPLELDPQFRGVDEQLMKPLELGVLIVACPVIYIVHFFGSGINWLFAVLILGVVLVPAILRTSLASLGMTRRRFRSRLVTLPKGESE